MQSVVRSFSYADWSLRLGWGFNFVDIFNFSYSKPQCVVPISCVNVLYTVHSDSIIYIHYSGIYFTWKRRENCQITHLLCAVLWYSKSSPSSWSQCDLNPGRVKHIPTFEALCVTGSSKFYFAMEFLLYLQTVLSLITTGIMMPREHVHSLYKCFLTPQLKAKLLNVWVDEFFARVITIKSLIKISWTQQS